MLFPAFSTIQEAVMSSTEKPEISFSELSLEPIDAPDAGYTGPIKMHPNTRTKADRRQTVDRRVVLRFEGDRRSGKSRRPQSSWEAGRNL
jgi:hypothetical protein